MEEDQYEGTDVTCYNITCSYYHLLIRCSKRGMDAEERW